MKPPYMKVQGEVGLVRDSASNAVLASDLNVKKRFIEEQKRELNIANAGKIGERVEKLEKDIDSIKNMLETLLNTVNHLRSL